MDSSLINVPKKGRGRKPRSKNNDQNNEELIIV